VSEQGEQRPRTWGWSVAIIVSAAATGYAFAKSPPVGFLLAAVTIAVVVSFFVWAFRRGRRNRAAGKTPDLEGLRQRMLSRVKWLAVLAVLSAGACVMALTTNDGSTPAWLLVAPTVLLFVGVIWTWLMAAFFLPRLRDQRSRTD
jgi:Flp pilus assembly protein TadB